MALAASPAGAAALDAGEGQRAYLAGRYAEARALWQPLAESGDHAAQVSMATLYDLGQGVPRDPAAAYGWYRRAAEGGLPEAELDVAVMLDAGDGVKRNRTEAAAWYARAAIHGSRRAQYNLGQLYLQGDGVPQNQDQAEIWLRDAATELPAAATKLASLQHATVRPPGAADEAATLVAVQLVAPPDGGTVTMPGNGADGMLELVWTAPRQAGPVRFFVQVMALDDDGAVPGMHEVFTGYVDESATLASIDRTPGRYAWRVYTVTRSMRHYAPSGWARFEIKPDT